MQGIRIKFIVGLTVLGIALVAGSYAVHREAAKSSAETLAAAAVVPSRPVPKEVTTRLTVTSGATFGTLLQHAGVDGATIQQMLDASRAVVNFRYLQRGQQLELVRSQQGEVEALHYQPDASQTIVIARQGDGFHAEEVKIPRTTQIVTVSGKVKDSLFNAVIAAGEHPELAVRLADIFAWDLDFYTDPRPGDTFRLVFEKKQYQGADNADYGQIFAAEYVNDGRPYRAVLFHNDHGQGGYYDAEGKSLQKAFLRSPLKFAARISSHYSTHRFHPILKRYMAHLGTDYAAPVGTPVQAVANGRVEFAGRKGGDGNMVLLRHSNGYETYYLHLSRILVHRGQSVRQGQLVGLVGATGLATGPHLDFRVRRSGAFINFERMKLPPAHPVAKADLKDFDATRDKWFGQMTESNPALAQARDSSAPQTAGP